MLVAMEPKNRIANIVSSGSGQGSQAAGQIVPRLHEEQH